MNVHLLTVHAVVTSHRWSEHLGGGGAELLVQQTGDLEEVLNVNHAAQYSTTMSYLLYCLGTCRHAVKYTTNSVQIVKKLTANT